VIRGTQLARLHGVTETALAHAAQVPAMGAASPRGAFCLPAAGKEGELWRHLISEMVQH